MKEQENNDRLAREIADLKARAQSVLRSAESKPIRERGSAVQRAERDKGIILGEPLSVRLSQKKESDERLKALKDAKQSESADDNFYSELNPAQQQTSLGTTATLAASGGAKKVRRVKKTDLSRYLDVANLTERQYQCASLHWEYGLSVSQIAKDLQLSRKTIDQHIHYAKAKMRSSGFSEKVKRKLSRVHPGE